MTNSAITKVLNKIDKLDNNYSLGFKRQHVLPRRVLSNFTESLILKGEKNASNIHEKQKNFLGSLTKEEFINWLKLA